MRAFVKQSVAGSSSLGSRHPTTGLFRWAVKDSNLRRLPPTDLQSVPFGHLGNRPCRLLIVDCRLSQRQSAINIHQSGADDGNRTRNLPLTRRLLCRLSYVGALAFRIKHKNYTKGIAPEQVLKRAFFESRALHTGQPTYNR